MRRRKRFQSTARPQTVRHRKGFWQMVVAWVVAVAVVAATGSIVQSQFNLIFLLRMDVSVPWTLWLQTTGHDLLGFAPNFAILVGLALAIAFPFAGWLSRRTGWRLAWFATAGGASILAMLFALQWVLPVTAIAAAREWAGIVALTAVGALGGAVFTALTPPEPGPHGPRL